MIDLEQYLYDVIKPIFDSWDEADIYAVSFFVYSNEMHMYRGFSNVTNFAVSYNTEQDCHGAGAHSEERWNYAFWRQNETPIFDSYEASPGTDVLFDWYAQQGITNIGQETEKMDAPVGFRELVAVVRQVARRFQEEDYFPGKFGKRIPILIHDLEYIPCVLEATAYANPNGEAADFLAGNWESAEMDFSNDPQFQKVHSEVSAIMGAVVANLGNPDFMNRLLGIKEEDAPDPEVEELMKVIFGSEHK